MLDDIISDDEMISTLPRGSTVERIRQIVKQVKSIGECVVELMRTSPSRRSGALDAPAAVICP